MSCEECRAAIRSEGAWNRFDSGRCRYCAARRIQHIKGFKRLPREQISARCTAALADAKAHGWSETEIRALVRGDMAVEPAAKQDVRKNP